MIPMKIGVPKEIKTHENRVALTPSGVAALTQAGHQVLVETSAGTACGYPDEQYRRAGAQMTTAAEAWSADLVVKVKEPQPLEYGYFRPNLMLFTYLHLAAAPDLADALMAKGVTAIGYETVQDAEGRLPLLAPMSEIAGRLAPQLGAQYLENHQGGLGILISGVPGVPAAHVVIVGGGTVGTAAAKMAVGMGARVSILDINPNRLAWLDDVFGSRIQTVWAHPAAVGDAVKTADIVIGAVLVPGARAPKVVTTEMVQEMTAGSVIVDVAIDQGGSVETIDRATTHENPTYTRFGVTHYAVANIPGSVARTATQALTNVTLPYVMALSRGLTGALQQRPELRSGINIADGRITHAAVAKALDRAYHPLPL